MINKCKRLSIKTNQQRCYRKVSKFKSATVHNSVLNNMMDNYPRMINNVSFNFND